MDFWNGAQPASTTSTISTSGAEQPAWLQEYTRSLMGSAVGAASQPYAEYQQPRIAGQDPLSQQATTMAQGNVGSWQPGVQFAGQTAPSQVSNYMNPYTSNVVDRIAQLGQRNLSENLLPQVNSTFTGAGQFGSTRNANFTNRALRDANESILGAQGQALNQGYQQSIQNFQNDATRLGNVGAMTAQLGAADVAQLDTLGRARQAEEQRNLDLNYENFQQQQQSPKQNLSWLSDIIRGLPAQEQTYQQNTGLPQLQSQASPLLQAAQAFSGTRALLSPTQQATK